MISHYIDSHCHLDRYSPDALKDIIARAVTHDVLELVTISTRLSDIDRLRSIVATATQDCKIWCTVGIHPDYTSNDTIPSARAIADLAQMPEVIGIGETGLDYTDTSFDRSRQILAFRRHIEAARLACMPLVIHSRDADQDMAMVLREEQRAGAFDFVLHCFSSGDELAMTGIELGGFISLSGILTFKKSVVLRELVHSLPTDRLLIETDAPFIARPRGS